MATIDEILGTNRAGGAKPIIPPVDGSLQGAPNGANEVTGANGATMANGANGGTERPGKPIDKPTLSQQVAGIGGRIVQPPKAPERLTLSTSTPKRMSYVQMFEKMNPNKPPTAEELAKEEKKKKREAIFSAIGDGISALSNLYFTSQYAPNAYDPRSSMSERTRARWDKAQREREANERIYMDGYLRAQQMDEAAERAKIQQARQAARDKANDELKKRELEMKKAKDDRDAALNDLKLQLYAGKITGQEFDNKLKEIKAQYQPALSQSQVNKNNRSNTGRSSGGGRAPGEHPWYDKNGNLHYAHSYEAARQNAQLNGTWDEGKQTSTTVKRKGRHTTTTTTTKTGKGHTRKPASKPQSAKSKFSIH